MRFIFLIGFYYSFLELSCVTLNEDSNNNSNDNDINKINTLNSQHGNGNVMNSQLCVN